MDGWRDGGKEAAETIIRRKLTHRSALLRVRPSISTAQQARSSFVIVGHVTSLHLTENCVDVRALHILEES